MRQLLIIDVLCRFPKNAVGFLFIYTHVDKLDSLGDPGQ